MTDNEIFSKAYKQAEKNGYDLKESGVFGFVEKEASQYYKIPMGTCLSYSTLGIEKVIFSHSFAKAFWGEKLIPQEYGYYICTLESWKYHLQQMILEEEPLKYLEKFLKGIGNV